MSTMRDMHDDVIDTIRWEQRRAVEHRIRVARIFALLQLAFLGVSLSAWAACLVGRLSGLLPVDELTQRYIMSLTSSLMLFAVGTAIIEQFRGDMVGGFLGRALAGVGLFVMAAHGYELLQKATACEMWSKVQESKGVANYGVAEVAEVIMETPSGMAVSWTAIDRKVTGPTAVTANRGDGRRRSMPNLRGSFGGFSPSVGRSNIVDSGSSGGFDEMQRRTSGNTTDGASF